MDGEFFSSTRKVMPFASPKAAEAPLVTIDDAQGESLRDGSPNNGNLPNGVSLEKSHLISPYSFLQTARLV